MKKTLPFKALFTCVITLFALQVNAQFSENFDGPNLSSGQLPCFRAWDGPLILASDFPGPPTESVQPLANHPNFSLNTTTPISGSGSLQFNATIVPVPSESDVAVTHLYTLYIPATAIEGVTGGFKIRANPGTSYGPGGFGYQVITGDVILSTALSPNEVETGVVRNFSFTSDEYGAPGDWKIVFTIGYIPNQTDGLPISISVDIDDFATDGARLPGCDAVLPVKLSKFSAKKSGSQARLDWTTTMEENSEGFAIERSADARKWETVGFVKSKRSNSTDVTDYAWIDENPLSAYNYYRLKQTDFDGSTELSRIVAINFGNEDLSILYPNPVTSRLFISEPASSIQIIDRKGHVVSQSASSPEEGIDVQSLATGLYFIKFQKQDGKTQSQKFIKQ